MGDAVTVGAGKMSCSVGHLVVARKGPLLTGPPGLATFGPVFVLLLKGLAPEVRGRKNRPKPARSKIRSHAFRGLFSLPRRRRRALRGCPSRVRQRHRRKTEVKSEKSGASDSSHGSLRSPRRMSGHRDQERIINKVLLGSPPSRRFWSSSSI
jgi:hypothetical protein